jgi:hypothetical protein
MYATQFSALRRPQFVFRSACGGMSIPTQDNIKCANLIGGYTEGYLFKSTQWVYFAPLQFIISGLKSVASQSTVKFIKMFMFYTASPCCSYGLLRPVGNRSPLQCHHHPTEFSVSPKWTQQVREGPPSYTTLF